jgi:hypothetical protein
MKSQQEIMGAMGQIQESVALINKSIETLQADHIEELFKKDGVINALQSGNIRRLDQNKVNTSLQAMAEIATSSLSINQALRVIEDNGGEVNTVVNMAVQALQVGNYSAFQSGMANFQSNLTGMTGTMQNVTLNQV